MKEYIVGLGEALWDVLPEGAKLGGAPANFAYHAGQFGYNALAVSALGEDELGEKTLKEFDMKGLNYIMPRVPFPTGTVDVQLDSNGVPSYDIKTGVAWDNIPFTAEIENVAHNCKAVCYGTLAQRNKTSNDTIQRFLDSTPEDCLKIYDINLRQNFYSEELITENLKKADMLKINDEELVILSKMFGYPELEVENQCWLLLGKYDLKILVLTCGTNGSYVFVPGKMSFQKTPKVRVADSVGAGDSFTGAFTAALLTGQPIEKAHKLAVEVSAYVCTQNGAMPELPAELLSCI